MIILLLFPAILFCQPTCYEFSINNDQITHDSVSYKFTFTDKYIKIEHENLAYWYKIKRKRNKKDCVIYKINNYLLKVYANRIEQLFSKKVKNIFYYCE